MLNMPNFKQNNILLMIAAILLILQGCVAVQTFPLAARSGDTITLALGSPEGVTRDNLTVEYYSDSNPDVPILISDSTDHSAIRTITKIYPDKTSSTWMSGAAGIGGASAHGSWLVVVVLDLPAGLPVGSGHFVLSAAPEVTFPESSKRFTDVVVDMEVLEGTGTSNTFSYIPYKWGSTPLVGNLTNIEPRPRVLIKFPQLSNNDIYGALEVKVTALAHRSDGTVIPPSEVRVVPDDQSDRLISQSHLLWSREGDDSYTINILAPEGMLYYEGRFSIVLIKNGNVYEPRLFSGTPTLESYKYYDLDGNEITGPTPELVLIQ